MTGKNNFVIKIIGSNGQKLSLPFDEGALVKDLKEKVFICWDKEYEPLNYNQRFFFSGNELETQVDDSTLVSHGFRDGCTVHIFEDRNVEASKYVAVKSLLPCHCLESGGVKVKIVGTAFEKTSSLCCKFGSVIVPCKYESKTSLTCTAPPHSPGVVSVEVSLNGTQFTQNGTLFTYVKFEGGLNGILTAPITDSCCSTTCSGKNEVEKAAIGFNGNDRV
eukprot:Nk52_evm9s360 gene=Nk52_evmTU9s360